MTEDYCKLVSGILLSTIWQEDDHTRLLWVTMLAVKDRHHRVLASVPGLASVANIPLTSCVVGLEKLSAPDPYSRTKDHEGRRIEAIEGGWLILNGEKYRNYLSKAERNDYQRKLMAQRRAVEKTKKLAGVSTNLAELAQAEADTEADTDVQLPSEVGANGSPPPAKKRTKKVPRTSGEIILECRESGAWPTIDIDIEWRKMVMWCSRNRREPTEKRFINWLNRIEKPVAHGDIRRNRTTAGLREPKPGELPL